MKLKNVFFFPNGNTCATDGKNQIPKLQESWFKLYIKFLKDQGIEVDENIVFNMPNGKKAKYMKEWDNWEIID